MRFPLLTFSGLRNIFLILGISTGILSCKKEEHKPIPLYPGISLESESTREELLESLNAADSLLGEGLNFSIEIPLLPDSLGKKLEWRAGCIDHLRFLSQEISKRKLSSPLTFSFVTRHREIIFPDGNLQDADAFFKSLKEIADTLNQLFRDSGCRLRMLWGEDWIATESHTEKWNSMFDDLRKDTILCSYFFSTERIGECGLVELSDEIAVAVSPTLRGGDKQYHSAWHEKACGLSGKSGKPVFIARANLITPNAALDFPFLFLNWPENCEIKGICLNTLSPSLCILDDSPYYGRKKDLKFLQELASYLEKNPY